jgi:hypothetical protein
MDQLLKRPNDALAAHPLALLGGAIGCYVLYGIAAGFFQGGWSVALALMKVPLIVLGSMALCIPSLYVFTSLAGADYTGRSFATAVAGFCGIAGLLLLALMPVIWLFSVSTISLTFVVWLHILAWATTLLFAHGFLARAIPQAKNAAMVWLFLLFFVSLQMTTYVRPVLWRAPGDPLFDAEKKSFFAHFDEVTRWKPAKPR